MHVPAETAVAETPSVPTCGGAVPRQLGWIVVPLSKRTSTPFDPAARIFASRSEVSQLGLGCGSVLTSPELVSATAALGAAPRTNARSSPATINSFLIGLPLQIETASRRATKTCIRALTPASSGPCGAGVVRATRDDRAVIGQRHADDEVDRTAGHARQSGDRVRRATLDRYRDAPARESRRGAADPRPARRARGDLEGAAALACVAGAARGGGCRPCVVADVDDVEATGAVGEPDVVAGDIERRLRHREVAGLVAGLDPGLGRRGGVRGRLRVREVADVEHPQTGRDERGPHALRIRPAP